MKKLPIGIQTFSNLIRDNYVYVDKTNYIYDLIESGKYYFLSRPRRFGKSLLISTLADIFAGNKDLFADLAISKLPYDWKKYFVIKISFADIPYSSARELQRGLKVYLQGIARHYKIMVSEKISPGEMLREIVMTLSKKSRVVILIDEYDYPILQHIHQVAMAEKIREILKAFYGVIKGLDEYIKFAFFTGVSKFSQTSIFSGLNNLNDISLDSEFNALLGYTHDEIITYFKSYLVQASHYNKCSIEQLLLQITEWYDGYLFTDDKDANKMHNPYSVLLFLSKKKFANYWFQTGTPTFLINLLKIMDYPMQDFEHVEVTEDDLGAFEVDDLPLETLLFQTGYLTIRERDADTGNYVLTYPNRETMTSLISRIFAMMTHKTKAYLNSTVVALLQALENLNFDQLFELLTRFYAAVPYTLTIDEEKYYQTIFYIVLKMVNADIMVEQATNIGRVDAVIQTKKHCFIIEFKINSTALKAIKQIEDKKYYQAYESLGKKIVLVGIVFDTSLKNISEIKHKLYSQKNQKI